MATLSQYVVSEGKRTHKDWAEHFGVSRSYFTELLAGTHVPSSKLMLRIQRKTDGKVTPNDWLEGAL